MTAPHAADVIPVSDLPRSGRMFVDPIEPLLVELPTDAIPFWRKAFSAGQFPLMLLAQHPLLEMPPEQLATDATRLARTGSSKDFLKYGRPSVADPLLLPSQAIRAALPILLPNEFSWIFPTRAEKDDIDLERFREQMTTSRCLTPEDAEQLTYMEGSFSGRVDDLPFFARHPDAIVPLAKPAVVHIDLGFFKGIYKNPVATPIYGLLHRIGTAIRAAGWEVRLVTLSYSNEDQSVSLEVRFLLHALAEMIRHPEMLDAGLPPAWEKRAQALYAQAMYLDSDAKNLIRTAALENLDDPAFLYDLANLALNDGNSAEGFDYLDRAVTLDPGYAVAYLAFGARGVELQQFDQSLEFGRKAKRHYPDNPFIDLGQAEVLLQMQRPKEALALIDELSTISWSGIYHPDIPIYLQALREKTVAALTATSSEKNEGDK